MRFLLGITIKALLIASLASTSVGQGAPAQMEAALLDLSARLGYSVSIGNLSNWLWEQTNFADNALGCPTASGGGGAILGYKFQLTHSAVIYDYRVSSDSTLVVYCGTIDESSASAEQAQATKYSNRLCDPAAAGGPYLRSRVRAGMDVEAVGAYLNLRGQPSSQAGVLLQIPAGQPVRATAGPECVDGYVWWLAIFGGQTGYFAEAGAGGYFAQPQPPPPIPSRERLSGSLAPYLQEFGSIRGNFQAAHAWSLDGAYLAMPGARGSDSVWIYDLRQPILSPQFLDSESGISALAFRPGHAQIAIGGEGGALQLWQIFDGPSLAFADRLYLNAHAGAVSAIAFSPAGDRLVSAGAEAYTQADVNRRWAALVWDLATVAQQAVLSGHDGLVSDLAFSPEGATIFTLAADNRLMAWDAKSGANLRRLDLPASPNAIAASPAGDLLALGRAEAGASLEIYDANSFARVASYPVPTNQVSSLAFSPDASMLLAGAADGIFSVWDTRAHQLLATRDIDGAAQDVSFSPDGALIAVSTDKGALVLFGVPLGSG